MVNRQNRYNTPQFRVTGGTKKGGLTSPTLFKGAVDNVVRHWLSMTVDDDAVIRDGMGNAVGQSMGVFY